MDDHSDRLKAALAGHYAIDRELGSGGMATVYLAEDLKHHRKVAVKVLRPDLAAALGSERFLREIEIAAQLHHPHILPLYDSGESDGFLYYVMPYEEGQSLRDKLARERELPIGEAVRILRDVVDALAHAHQQGVVHRDIKPDNVLLSGRHALVTDFGVAKAVSEATGRQKLTTAGVALGTPAYMAPEQAVADPQIDHRADIYAVGTLAYELLAGRPPFSGTSPQEVLTAHVTEAPDAVTDHRTAVPPVLGELVMKCLEKKPADRWQSADELLVQFEALATPSGGVTPTGTMPVTAVAPRSRKLVIGAAAAAVVVAAAAIVFLLPEKGAALVPNRVVVAVFENETADPTLDPVGRMAGDWITQGLQQAGVVEVIAWPTALQSSRYVQAEVEAGRIRDPVHALAEETSAGTVISGAYYREGDTLQLQVHVTDAVRGRLLGSPPPVSGSPASPREAIERLRERVMGFLAVSVDERLAGQASTASQPPRFDAYRAFNDGMDYYIREEYRSALPHLYRAFDLDSSFVTPLLYAAINHFNLDQWAAADSVLEVAARFRDQLSPYYRDWLEYLTAELEGDNERAFRAIRRAAEAAPGSKAVYNRARMAGFTGRPQEAIDALATLDPARGPMRGWSGYWAVLASVHGQLGEYERQLETVLEGRREHSNNPILLEEQAEALSALGRLEELTEVLNDIDALPPRPALFSGGAIMARAAMEHRAHGHPQAAQDVFQRAITWYESRPPDEKAETSHRKGYGIALYEAERWDEAASVFGALAEEFPDSVDFRGTLGVLAARHGDRKQALTTSEWLQGIDQPYLFGSHTFIRARIAAVLGEQERAVALLREAAVQGSTNMFLLHAAIDLTSLRDYPPFQELLRPKG